ncbi:MAG: DNA polymerase III subunit delta [Cyclobacteriaceae bacterium]
MRFAEIPGLDDLKTDLVRSANRNHHAQIFYGKPGSANLALALAYATYINCQEPTKTDSCGECPSCTKMDKLVHPDLHLFFPVSGNSVVKTKDANSEKFLPDWRTLLATNKYPTLEDWVNHYGAENKQVNISKEESRQIIQKLSLKAFEARYKIMLIWLPEWMHPTAANGILKILEEPSDRTIFLMVSNDYQKLLTTIISRCQLFHIRSFNDEEIVSELVTQYDVERSTAIKNAAQCEGNMNAAIKLIDDQSDEIQEKFSEWMRLCWKQDFTRLVSWADEYQAMTKVNQKNLLLSGINLLRGALIAGLGVAGLNSVADTDAFAANFGQTVSPDAIEKITQNLNEAHFHIERNASAKLTFLDVSLTVAQILKA